MTNTKSFNKILFTVLIVLAFLFGQNAGFLSLISGQYSIADNAGYVANSVSATSTSGSTENISTKLTDYNFSTSSGSSYPLKPTYWTASDVNSSIYYGVIDISKITTTNCKNCGFAYVDCPLSTGASEDKVLMINSDEASTTQGYSSKSGFTLEAGSYYSITVNVWTDNTAFASIYLTGDSFDSTGNAKFTSVSTSKQWTSYTFWVATSEIANEKVGLDLYLGAKYENLNNPEQASVGMVLFDNISITQYSSNLFDQYAQDNTKENVIDLSTNLVNQTSGQDGFINNGDFNTIWKYNEGSGNASMSIVDVATFSGNSGILDNVIPGTNYTNLGKAMMFVADNGYCSYTSADIIIKRSEVYRISFWAKGAISSGNMYAVLSGDTLTSTDENDPNYQVANFTTISTTSNAFTNDWVQYSFYVTGNPLSNTTATLSLGLGASTTASATGYIFFSGLTTQILSSSQKSTASSIGQSTTLDIYPTADLNFTNGYFNYSGSDADGSTPDEPTNWSHSQTDENDITQSGIINVDADKFYTYDLGTNINRPDSTLKHNVLYLRNYTSTSQSYNNNSSSPMSAIDSSSTDTGYYKFTIDIQIQNTLANSGAYVYLKDGSNNTIAWLKTTATQNEWQTYTIYIKNYYMALSLTPYLYLGTETQPTTGIAFFDNCILETTTADVFTNATANNTTIFKVNLSTDGFNEYTSVTNNIYTPSLWNFSLDKSSTDNSDMGGIINTSHLTGTPIYVNPTTSSNENLLYIYSQDDSYAYFTSKLSYSLTASSYYKISVKVKTFLLSQNEDDINTSSNDSSNSYGANIQIQGVEKAQFTGIDTTPTNSNGDKVTYTNDADAFNDVNNKFVEYTFYVCQAEDTNIVIQLGLGSLDALTSGYAFFDDFSVTSITADDYTNQTSNYKSEDDYPDNIISLVNTAPDEETTNPESYSPDFDWVAVPTIIIAFAVIVAVVGFMLKRLNERRVQTVTYSTNYDRIETLLKDVKRRDRLSAIHQRIRELNEELAMSEKFLKEEKEAFKKEQEAYSTAKEIAIDTGIEIDKPEIEQHDFEQTIEQLNDNMIQIKQDLSILEVEKERIKKQEEKDIEKASKIKIIKKRK